MKASEPKHWWDKVTENFRNTLLNTGHRRDFFLLFKCCFLPKKSQKLRSFKENKQLFKRMTRTELRPCCTTAKSGVRNIKDVCARVWGEKMCEVILNTPRWTDASGVNFIGLRIFYSYIEHGLISPENHIKKKITKKDVSLFFFREMPCGTSSRSGIPRDKCSIYLYWHPTWLLCYLQKQKPCNFHLRSNKYHTHLPSGL